VSRRTPCCWRAWAQRTLLHHRGCPAWTCGGWSKARLPDLLHR
jgi:hypothetical protein